MHRYKNNIKFLQQSYSGKHFEYRHCMDGVEEADSFNMNAHKWLMTNFDCSLLWVKDRSVLIQSLSTNPKFLKNKASQGNLVIDYKDWQIPLGRRFRSLKLWMVMRFYGLEGLQTHIRNDIALAAHFEELVGQDIRFKVVGSLADFTVGAPLTEVRHVNGAWQILQEKASALLESV